VGYYGLEAKILCALCGCFSALFIIIWIQRVIHKNIMSPKVMNDVFTKIDCHLKKSSGTTYCPLFFYSRVINL